MIKDEPLNIVAILGSVRTGRFGPTVSAWFTEFANQRDDMTVTELDLVDFDFSHAFDETPGQITFCSQIAPADGFVIVTPEYNHSFPGQLKTAIDCTDREFFGKPVAFVSYGGLSGGLRAVEALRLVMAELHAITIREALSFHRGRTQFGEDGVPIDIERATQSATRMLDQMAWWAEAARNRRAATPYPG